MSTSPNQPMQTQSVVGGGRICFRGDTREPNLMFSHGFFSRDDASPIMYRPGQGAAGDIDPPTAVCVSPRFTMAPLFPIDRDVTRLWVYAVYVRELANTHAKQVADGLEAIKKEVTPGAKATKAPNALWPLYAQELATKMIDAKDVICALIVSRTWIMPGATEDDFNPLQGCDYTLDKTSLTSNPQCGLDASMKNLVTKFLNDEPGQGRTPEISSGFHKSRSK